MAYCVRCGVKLPGGAHRCPLCNTEVVLPPGMDEQGEESLFPLPLPEKKCGGGMGKTEKGVFELVTVCLAVAELSLALVLWSEGLLSHGFLPLFVLPMSGLLFSVVMLARHTYTVQTTFLALFTAVLLCGIDGVDGTLSWSPIVGLSLLAFWIFAVLPFFRGLKGRPVVAGICMAVSPPAFLLGLNVLLSGRATWFVPVALPVVGVSYAGLFVIFLRIRSRKGTRFPLADVLFMAAAVVCYVLCVADVLSGHYRIGIWRMGWSYGLLPIGAVLTVFLCIVSASGTVRRFFTSQYRR